MNDLVYYYTVCYRKNKFYPGEWYEKVFTEIEEAKRFAKQQINDLKPDPYIVEQITFRSLLTKDCKCTYVDITNKELVRDFQFYSKNIEY